MKKLAVLTVVLAVALSGMVQAQRITESLDNWILGTNSPEISNGTRGDASSGDYMHLLIGTSPLYYEVMMEGEGVIDFWVYDPGLCLESTDPGYGTNGPRWGVQSPLYQSISVGVGRASYAAGCQGYSPWSTVAPYSFYWFHDGLRASHGVPFTAGWFQWAISGTWDDASFTIFDVDYLIDDGPPHDDLTHGDYTGTYDATSFGGAWEALFGEGWKAFYLKGDGASGIEDMSVDCTGGSGVFDELGASPVAKSYTRSSWSEVKNLYR